MEFIIGILINGSNLEVTVDSGRAYSQLDKSGQSWPRVGENSGLMMLVNPDAAKGSQLVDSLVHFQNMSSSLAKNKSSQPQKSVFDRLISHLSNRMIRCLLSQLLMVGSPWKLTNFGESARGGSPHV